MQLTSACALHVKGTRDNVKHALKIPPTEKEEAEILKWRDRKHANDPGSLHLVVLFFIAENEDQRKGIMKRKTLKCAIILKVLFAFWFW